jgi:phage terminase large subunit-like protein
MAEPSSAELKDILAGLKALDYRRTYQQFYDFTPYPKQREHLDLGRTKRERLLIAGNQNGKTHTGAFEAACHLTGIYPKAGEVFYPDTPEMRAAGLAGQDAFPGGWQGRRWTRPTKGWIAGETSLVVRDVQQKKLCGEPGVDELFGTGLIPKDLFVDKPSLARGVTDAYDTIQVRHVSGGISVARFKSYEQGRQKFQGESIDWGWPDEEPPEDVYAEFLTRTVATGGMMFMTFTPLKGRSSVVLRFLDEPSPDRAVTSMTIEDALHIPAAERKKIIDGYLPHEREARARGVPTLGSGRIFMAPEETIIEPALEYIPPMWAKLWGVDFGSDHPFGAVLILWDRDADVIHVHHCIRIANTLPLQHAAAMKPIGINVPVAWPNDGNIRRDDGKPMADHYKRCGLKMLDSHATWPDGSVSTEAGILEMDEREHTGRLKYAAHLSDILEERRFYHRKDGKIVKLKDDLLSALRVAVMQKRSAKVVQLGGRAAAAGNNGPHNGFAIGTPGHPDGDFDAFSGQ